MYYIALRSMKKKLRKKSQLKAGRSGSRALIVTGRRSSKINGSLADVTEALEREGREYVIFDRVEENPSVETVMEAREEGLRAGADLSSAWAADLRWTRPRPSRL